MASCRHKSLPAVFAVFPANYQRVLTNSSLKSWAFGTAASQRTATPPAVLPLFSAIFAPEIDRQRYVMKSAYLS
jgi:hypothetical protein